MSRRKQRDDVFSSLYSKTRKLHLSRSESELGLGFQITIFDPTSVQAAITLSKYEARRLADALDSMLPHSLPEGF